jgi:porin
VPLAGLTLALSAPSVEAQEAPGRGEPVVVELTYTGDVFSNLRGGVSRGTDYLGDLSAVLTIDLGAVLDLEGATLFAYGLANHGGDPSVRMGDAQVASNIEAPNTGKLYELWYEQNVSDRASFLVGLYDVNSEFDVIDAAGLFLNSSFGVGAEFGASGVNGPSIFPTTSLGARAIVRPTDGAILKLAALDGVPGDPDDPRGTHVSLGSGDGILYAAEANLLRGGNTEDRGIGRTAEGAYGTKLALGAWHYTTNFDDLRAGGTSEGSHGVYAFVAHRLWDDPEIPDRGVTVFARTGWAEPDVNPVMAHVGGGFVYDGPFRGRPQDQWGMGVTAAINGDAYRDAGEMKGERPEEAEVTFELTYRFGIGDHVGLQPDLQYVVNPGTDPSLSDALALALRFDVTP